MLEAQEFEEGFERWLLCLVSIPSCDRGDPSLNLVKLPFQRFFQTFKRPRAIDSCQRVGHERSKQELKSSNPDVLPHDLHFVLGKSYLGVREFQPTPLTCSDQRG